MKPKIVETKELDIGFLTCAVYIPCAHKLEPFIRAALKLKKGQAIMLGPELFPEHNGRVLFLLLKDMAVQILEGTFKEFSDKDWYVQAKVINGPEQRIVLVREEHFKAQAGGE